ncbi:uncharacterized protein ATNIH1004_000347 [Aspergillus tanneri]|nr:uncharacterized protein ATNIH1004_000347 [Aspergillus tanneri]KAA8651464.1 hypothetical protein ATNIH1004_000347 [Aspergillus tanneri]
MRTLGVAALTTVVEARSKLPLSSTDPEASLKEDTEVTFDPLGVAAVLHNPRADNSAAMLYTQYDYGVFTWPHTMMIGGTLAPLKMLVEHLTEEVKSNPPAVSMCTKVSTLLSIRSDISGSVFRELPLDSSNFWLNTIISFKASKNPDNDFAVVYVGQIYEDMNIRKRRVKDTIGSVRWWIGTLTLDLIGLLNGLMMIAGLVIGVLVADMWATTLFFLYWCHWIGTVLISFNRMVEKDRPDIKEDGRMRYAIHERKVGGTVIFKGQQDQLEKWARSKWKYEGTLWQNCLHWFWITTGTLSAFCSLACMVNMQSYMQLGFLGVLVYSSLAEILATRVSRTLQVKAKGNIHMSIITGSKTRTEAIIRATLESRRPCRLKGIDWINLELLPPMDVFQYMQEALKDIGNMQEEWEDSMVDVGTRNQQLRKKLAVFIRQVEERDKEAPADQKQLALASRIEKEIERALKYSLDSGKEGESSLEAHNA